MMFQTATAFAAYVVWLLAFPMEGFLLASGGDPHTLLWFLLPHAVALGALAVARRPARGLDLYGFSGGLTAVLTALFPFLPAHHHALLIAAGVSSAPLVIRIGACLAATPEPKANAVWGLVGGNVLLAVLGPLPLPVPGKYGLLALGLMVASVLPRAGASNNAPNPDGRTRHGWSLGLYLPFIFFFHLVSGLFYGRLLPAYGALQPVPGVELAFYCATGLVALYVLGGSVDGAMAWGIPSSLAAMVFFGTRLPFAIHLSMYTMQAASGFMDAFLLFLILDQPRPARAFAAGVATMCIGIAGGDLLALATGPTAGTLTAVGNAALNLALLSLYLAHRKSSLATPASVRSATEQGVSGTPSGSAPRFHIPPALQARLSTMERQVLDSVLAGKTFREAARTARVSESSVKTYMQRIYAKAEVKGKRDLLHKLSFPG